MRFRVCGEKVFSTTSSHTPTTQKMALHRWQAASLHYERPLTDFAYAGSVGIYSGGNNVTGFWLRCDADDTFVKPD